MELQVMILDDEYIILDGLCSFPWSDYGYQVAATAKNGLEGLEKLEHIKPDLILTDVRMFGCPEWMVWILRSGLTRCIRIRLL